jgi:hypothetical protein
MEKHPLADIVAKAFDASPRHDGTSLAPFLFGTAAHTAKEFTYYRGVAEHTLRAMEKAGTLTRDRFGWFLMKKENVARLPLAHS